MKDFSEEQTGTEDLALVPFQSETFDQAAPGLSQQEASQAFL